jgi:NAD(P)-dependent dehydrogenase (short-subunit alcohol dehydrogenase family)
MSALPSPHRLFSLSGRSALVTGAGSGIGAAIADCLAGAGADVICAGRTLGKLDARVATIRTEGGKAHALAFDVAQEAQVEAAFAEISRRGGIDILVNNAALMTKHDFLTMSGENWDALHATNTRGAFLCAREAVKLMATRGGGSIVNIGSVAALHASVHGNAQYGASKAGLLALTRSIAVEFAAAGVRCNMILPGAVATEGSRAVAEAGYAPRGPFAQKDRILLGRIGAPSDIAAAALYLCSDAASYVTGQTLVVDGGLMVG